MQILLCEALIALCFVAFNINVRGAALVQRPADRSMVLQYVYRSSLPKFPEKGKEKKSA